MNYTTSHTAAGKGAQYDEFLIKDRFAAHCWEREQGILSNILSTFYQSKECHLLDFACGTGRIVAFMEGRVTSATGVDVSPAMLSQAAKKVKRARLVQANLIESGVFPLGSFNLITAFRFFTNAESELRLAVLRRLYDLLAIDGHLVFNSHQHLNSPCIRLLRGYAGWKGLPMMNSLSWKDCCELAENAGFEIVKVYGCGLLRIPRVPLPRIILKVVDRLLGGVKVLSLRSSSPVIIARKKALTGVSR